MAFTTIRATSRSGRAVRLGRRLGGTGDFTEYNRNCAGRNGQDTAHADGSNTADGQPYSKQIDYIFFSTNRAPLDGAPVKIEADSPDHDLVAATVRMRK